MPRTLLTFATFLILLTSCNKSEQILGGHDFDSGQYVLYAIQAEGTPTEFVRQHSNFKVTDIKTLNDFKNEWRLSSSQNSWACGLNYSFYLMKDDSCIDKFYVNLECGFLNSSKGSFLFSEDLLSDHKKAIIDLSADSAKIIEDKIIGRHR